MRVITVPPPRASRKWSGLLVLLLCLIAIVGYGVWAKSNNYWPFTQTPNAPTYTLSAWEWRSPQEFNKSQVESYVEAAAADNFRTLYIDVTEYVDIRETADPAEAAGALQSLNTSTKQFVQAAQRKGIEVHALAGSVNWAEPDYRYLTEYIVEFVAQYNQSATNEEKLRGLQFDIESYNLKDFDDRKTKVLTDYLTTVQTIQTKRDQVAPGLLLGFAIPYWFDNENNNIPPITWNGNSKPVGYHLFDMLQANGGYVAIMDYRDTASGKNGSIEQVQNEFAYAEKSTPKVKIAIGQLVTEAKPASTTFYQQDKALLDEAVTLLAQEYADSPVFDSFAIHDFKGYQKL